MGRELEGEGLRRLLRQTRRWLAASVLAIALAAGALFVALKTTDELSPQLGNLPAETDAALLQQPLAITAFARQEARSGDQLTAVLLALEVLPAPAFGGTGPVLPDAAAVLR